MPMPCESWPLRLAWLRFSVTSSTSRSSEPKPRTSSRIATPSGSARMKYVSAMCSPYCGLWDRARSQCRLRARSQRPQYGEHMADTYFIRAEPLGVAIRELVRGFGSEEREVELVTENLIR